MKTAILFSGQGAQFPGMLRALCDRNRETRALFDLAREATGRDVYRLAMESTPEELDRTENTQPCLLACELAAFRAFLAEGIPFDAALGFSLGEWAALVAAGALPEREALAAVAFRAEAMQRAVPLGAGAMVAVLGRDDAFVSALCEEIGGIAPAIYNCPGSVTTAGTFAAAETLLQRAASLGVAASRVSISVPVHCALMRPAAEALSPVLRTLPFATPRRALVMNAVGVPVWEPEAIIQNLIDQLVFPVRFRQSIEFLLDEGYGAFVEIGPGKTLSGMVRRTAKAQGKTALILQVNSPETLQNAAQTLCI